jgi:hypothetical protein
MGFFRELIQSAPKQPAPEQEPKGREITDREAAEFARDKDFEGIFIGTIKEEKRDAEGKLLRPDTVVIRNPDSPGSLMEDNPKNRREFVQHGFSFEFKDPYLSPEERAKAEKEVKALVEGEVKGYFSEVVKNSEDFMAKVNAIKPVSLTKDMRDAEHKLLRKGTEVIIDPVYEEEVMEDTPENRAIFVKNGGTWKKEK